VARSASGGAGRRSQPLTTAPRVDRRTRVGKALAAWRAALAVDLGGLDQLSTQPRAR
jgi:hypothetical protein